MSDHEALRQRLGADYRTPKTLSQCDLAPVYPALPLGGTRAVRVTHRTFEDNANHTEECNKYKKSIYESKSKYLSRDTNEDRVPRKKKLKTMLTRGEGITPRCPWGKDDNINSKTRNLSGLEE